MSNWHLDFMINPYPSVSFADDCLLSSFKALQWPLFIEISSSFLTLHHNLLWYLMVHLKIVTNFMQVVKLVCVKRSDHSLGW